MAVGAASADRDGCAAPVLAAAVLATATTPRQTRAAMFRSVFMAPPSGTETRTDGTRLGGARIRTNRMRRPSGAFAAAWRPQIADAKAATMPLCRWDEARA